jgi:hypothetical protein
MPHSYEELRAAALDILTGREHVSYEPSQYEQLSLGLGEVFARREGRIQPARVGATYPLDAQDKESAVSSPKRNSAFSGWKLSVDGLL